MTAMRRMKVPPRRSRRKKHIFVVVSPHQDDEWLGCMHMMYMKNEKRAAWSSRVIMVTESLYPDLGSYRTRRKESMRASAFVGATYHSLGVKEESLFERPYDQSTYTGSSQEDSYVGKMVNMIKKVTGNNFLHLAYPSSTDAAGHVVHEFARNVVLKALPSLSPKSLVQYTIYSTGHVPGCYVYPVRSTLKFRLFKQFYPTQWKVIKADSWALQVTQWHCRYEYEVIL